MASRALFFALVVAMASVVMADGSCSNTADLAILNAAYNTMHTNIQSCAVTCTADGACVTTCLHDAMSLSTGCATCFGDVTQCGAQACYAQCIASQTSEACTSCTLTNCQPALLTCTGLTAAQLPPNHGGCDTTADKAVFAAQWNTFYNSIRGCTYNCTADAACTATCLSTATGVSSHCSQCYGAVAQCGAQNCYATCIADPFGAACQECTLSKCQPAFEACTGLPMEQVPPNHGACDDTADKAVFAAQWNTYHLAIQQCAQQCNADGACTATCLAAATNTSAHCSQCFGDVTQCGAQNCYAACINAPLSDACTSCTLQHCQAAMTICTGLQPSQLPPSTAGACANTADQSAFSAAALTFHEKLSSCASQCTADASCTSTCLAAATSVSSGCSACFGAEVSCGAANCYATCATAQDSPACELCTRTSCDAALSSCAGLPVAQLPAGQCENVVDLTVLAGSGFATQYATCQTSSSYAAAATATCLQTAYSTMSATCANCYGTHAACYRTTCAPSCRVATSTNCKTCRATCLSKLNTCAGVAAL